MSGVLTGIKSTIYSLDKSTLKANVSFRGTYSKVRYSDTYPASNVVLSSWGSAVTSASFSTTITADLGTQNSGTTGLVFSEDQSYVQTPESSDTPITLHQGSTYIFDVSATVFASRPFAFSTKDPSFSWTTQKANLYTTGVTTAGSQGTGGATVTLVVAADMPTLYPINTVAPDSPGTGECYFVRGASSGYHIQQVDAPYGENVYYFAGLDSSNNLVGAIESVTIENRAGLANYVTEAHDGTGNITIGLVTPFYDSSAAGNYRLLGPADSGNSSTWTVARDHISETVSLGFNFPVGDKTYYNAVASINGWVMLDGDVNQDASYPMHSPSGNAYAGSMANVVLFPWWTPQKPAPSNFARSPANSYGGSTVTGGLYFRREFNPNRAIFTWLTLSNPAQSTTANRLLEYQVVLHPDGQIEYRTEAISTTGSPATTSSAAKGVRLTTDTYATGRTMWTDSGGTKHYGDPVLGDYRDILTSGDNFPQNDSPSTGPVINATETANWTTNTTYIARTESGGKTVIIPNDTFSLNGAPFTTSNVSSEDPMFQNWELNPEVIYNVTVAPVSTTTIRDDTGRDTSLGYGLNELHAPSGEGLSYGRTGILTTNPHFKFNASAASLELIRGQLYVFDQSDSTNRYYPIQFSIGKGGENKNFKAFTPGVSYWLDNKAVDFTDYATALNNNTAVAPKVHLLVSSNAFDADSTPSQLYPYVKDKAQAGGSTRISVTTDNKLLPFPVVKPISIIITADENFFGERPVEHRFSYREWFNSNTVVTPTGLNFFDVFYYQGLIHLKVRHGADHWNWSTSALNTSNGMLDGTISSTSEAAYTVTTGGFYTFYAQAADSANRPVGSAYVASIEITPANFVVDAGCPETMSEDTQVRYRATPINISAPPTYDPQGDTTPLIDVLSVTFARPYIRTDGLNNLTSTGVSVHVIILAHHIDYWAYWLDDLSDNKTVVRETPQSTFLMDRSYTITGDHVLHVCGYDSSGTKVAESSRTFQFNPGPLPYIADPTDQTAVEKSRDIHQWFASMGLARNPRTIIWDDRFLGNFDPSVSNPRLGWLNWVRRSTTTTNTIASGVGSTDFATTRSGSGY